MAAGQNVPELGGYDYEFTGKVPDDWECLVCHLPMKDPVQIVGCGHRVCNICMESLLRRYSPLCPADRQPLSREKIFPDAACHRRILDLVVKCSHFGCPWTGELRAIEKHHSECLLKVVQCSNSGCSEKLTKQDMKTHVTSECCWRKINCEYCREPFVFNQKQTHFDVCQTFPVQCTNKCGLRDIPRQKLDIHIRDECPETKVYCEYKNIGCEAVFSRSNAKSHSESQVERHLNLALRSMEATRFQVHDLVSLVKDQSHQIERLMTKDNEKSRQIERLMTKDNEKSQEIERLITKDNEKSQQIERLMTKDNEKSQEMERLMFHVKDQSQQKERLMTTVHYQSKDIEVLKIVTNTRASFAWKIPNIQAILDRSRFENEDIVSEPFYLSEHGYKLRIIMKPSRPSFVFHVQIVPGEFDHLLSWPFMEKVRVTLIDQNPCKDKREDIWYFIDYSNTYKKDDEFDYCRTFITHDKLRTGSYIMNDAIFIMANKE